METVFFLAHFSNNKNVSMLYNNNYYNHRSFYKMRISIAFQNKCISRATVIYIFITILLTDLRRTCLFLTSLFCMSSKYRTRLRKNKIFAIPIPCPNHAETMQSAWRYYTKKSIHYWVQQYVHVSTSNRL